MDYLEKSKKEWVRASTFPADKEKEYPMHTVVQEFSKHTNKSVYEYGIGGGSDVMSYLRRGNHVTGTDIVPRNLEVTKQRIIEAGLPIENVELVLLQDSHPLPFSDNYFDIISSHGVLHHIKEPEPVINELYRILKKDGFGYAMLYTDVLWSHFESDGTINGFMKQYNIDKFEAFCYATDAIGVPYARPYTTEEGCELFQRSGFQIIDFTHWMQDFFCTYKFTKT